MVDTKELYNVVGQGSSAIIYKKEFGMPEAIWEFEVKDFPAIVAMDSKGSSVYEQISKMSGAVYKKVVGF